MTQLAPSNLFLTQLAAKVSQFRDDYTAGKFANVDEVIAKLADIITEMNLNAHKPLTEYEPVIFGEPPTSIKMNRFWSNLQTDINAIEDQLSVLQAATLFLHNYFATELQKASNKNAQAANKLKTLQLYASAHDPNIVTFGDFFRTQDFIDLNLTSSTNMVSLDIAGQISLGRSGVLNDLSKNAAVKILATSNGFLGNNQEIDDPLLAAQNPADGTKFYTFVAQANRHANLQSITDADPTTWIEYEANQVSKSDQNQAKNFGFTYRLPAAADGNAGVINWADGPPSNILRLNIEFDLKAIKVINRIAYTPFGLKGDINPPVKVTSIQISEAGTDWIVLNPQNVFIGTEVNLKAADTADNVTVNTAEWSFPESNVRYVRINIEQSNPVASNIGHLFFERKSDVTQILTSASDAGITVVPVANLQGRVEGPIPPIENPASLYKGNNTVVRGTLVQGVEYFQGKRWAIGIRDCLIQEVKYIPTSVMVSKLFRIDSIVDRVSLEADVDVPTSFDHSEPWIKFFISPNDGVSWYQISRIQDDFLNIPEILAFNDPLPVEFRENGVGYHTVPGTVNALRVKIEISRPQDQESSSPILRSYTLKVRKR